MLTPIRPPAHVTTVEVFLRPEDLPPPARRGSLGKRAKPAESALSWCSWVRHLNRLVTRNGIVFAGEEPIRYAHFYDLLTGLRRDLPIEICTRLGFDVSEWLARVSPDRFDAARLTPTLRVRFDPRTMDAETTIERALLLQGAGFQIGLRAVLVPRLKASALTAAERGRRAGLDFTTEPFVGVLDGRLFGQFRYRNACRGRSEVPSPEHRRVLCRSRQLIVSPNGSLFGCHHDLIAGGPAMGRLSDERPRLAVAFHPCAAFGSCDPRDVAVVLAHGHAGGSEVSRKPASKAASPAPARQPLRGVLAHGHAGGSEVSRKPAPKAASAAPARPPLRGALDGRSHFAPPRVEIIPRRRRSAPGSRPKGRRAG